MRLYTHDILRATDGHHKGGSVALLFAQVYL